MGQDLSCILGKQSQELVLDRGEMDFPAGHCDRPGGVVDHQVSVREKRGFLLGACDILHAPLRCPDAGQQFVDGKGFCQVIVGTGVKGGDLVAVFAAGADDNDDRPGPGADGADDLDAVDIRQAQIQQDQVRPVRGAEGDGFLSGGCSDMGIVVDLQCGRDEAGDGLVILDDQYFHFIHG